MSPILCHQTALEYWMSPYAASRLLDQPASNFLGPSSPYHGHLAPQPFTIKRNSTNAQRAAARDDPSRLRHCFPAARQPYHVLALSHAGKRTIRSIIVHTATRPLPPQSFYECRIPGLEHVSVVCPELCFIQAAEHASFAQLVKIGHELCSQYCYLQLDGTIIRRPPITNARELSRYLGRANQLRGLPAARIAAQYLCDGAASPREVEVAMLLSLPKARGGYGISKPQLNRRIGIPDNRGHFLQGDCFFCDFYWPHGKVALEYDSDEHHAGSTKIALDAARRDALALLGIEVITLTNQQLNNPKEMDRVARLIARKTGGSMRANPCYDWKERRRELRRELFQLRR